MKINPFDNRFDRLTASKLRVNLFEPEPQSRRPESHRRIKDLPKIDRPREKLEKYGPERLSNSELLAILLRTGTKGINVVELSKKILRKFPKERIAGANFRELKSTFGLGAAKACEIVACFELGRRLLQNKQSALVLSPKDVWDEMKDIRDNKKEHFVIFFLDSRNQEIKREIISVGSLNANLVHPREVFEPAIGNLASHIIIAHNHPSGDTEPSMEDLKLTKRLQEAGKIVGIEIVDQVKCGKK
ncbi:MAG: DNA repair protein RadC [Candidatus Jorgensenbacteria bacterium]